MKKILVAIGLFLALGSSGFCASQPQSLGVVTASTTTFTGGVALWSQTAAQIAALTSTTTGQMVYCSNCGSAGGNGTMCISTGTTAVYQFVLSTGTACK